MKGIDVSQYKPKSTHIIDVANGLKALAPQIRQLIRAGKPPTFQSIATQLQEQLGHPVSAGLISTIKHKCDLPDWTGRPGNANKGPKQPTMVASLVAVAKSVVALQVDLGIPRDPVVLKFIKENNRAEESTEQDNSTTDGSDGKEAAAKTDRRNAG